MGFFQKAIGSIGKVVNRIGSTSHNVLRRIGSVGHSIKDAASSFDEGLGGIPSDFVRSLPFGSAALKGGSAVLKGIDAASQYSKKAADIGGQLERYGHSGTVPPIISKYR